MMIIVNSLLISFHTVTNLSKAIMIIIVIIMNGLLIRDMQPKR